jgi:hypothetical protein
LTDTGMPSGITSNYNTHQTSVQWGSKA